MSKDEIVERIFKNVPYSSQVSELDTTADEHVRFTWRGNRFQANARNQVDEVGDGVLIGSDIAILMRAILFGKQTP